jgi:YHS domain-containing protein
VKRRRFMQFSKLVGAVALLGVFALGCNESSTKASEPAKSESTSKVANDNPDPANCPVSGHAVDGKTFVELNGKKYEFCCGDCVATFKADPQKFLAKK